MTTELATTTQGTQAILRLVADGLGSEHSRRAYEKALTYQPNDPNVLTDLGTMYLSSSQAERAAELFRRAAALDPKHAESRFNLGMALLQTGDKEGARRAFQEVRRIDGTGKLAEEAAKQLAKLGS